jgi:hypothetical protein
MGQHPLTSLHTVRRKLWEVAFALCTSCYNFKFDDAVIRHLGANLMFYFQGILLSTGEGQPTSPTLDFLSVAVFVTLRKHYHP